MTKSIKHKLIAIVAAALLSVGAVAATSDAHDRQKGSQSDLAQKVRKQLVTLPYYGVFDNLAYEINGSSVTLYGQVVKPVTKSDAASRVKNIDGVARVVNNIQVLPLSSADNAIRVRTYRAVFGSGGLYRYAMGANPSVHIIVSNGHVTLEGIVGSVGDRNLANIRANGVSGVFSVTNNLKIEGQNAR